MNKAEQITVAVSLYLAILGLTWGYYNPNSSTILLLSIFIVWINLVALLPFFWRKY